MDRSIAPALLGTLALTLAACSGGTGTDAGTAGSGDGEGTTTISLYTSEPQEKVDELVAAFTEAHPDIAVETFRAGTGDLTTRIEAERTSGEVQADVLLAADAPTFETYKAEELLAPLEFDTSGVMQNVVDADGYYVGTRIIPTVIAYNTGAVDTPPASWQDLTSPDWAEKIVMPNPDVSGAAAFNAAAWMLDPQLGEQWLEALAANKPVIADSNGPVAQAVAAGTQPVGIVVDYLVRDLAAQGSPIAVSYPSEGAPYIYQPVGVFASSDQLEASRTFAEWLISPEAQELAAQQAYLPVREDVSAPEGAPVLNEIALLEVDIEEVNAARADAVSLFNSLFQ